MIFVVFSNLGYMDKGRLSATFFSVVHAADTTEQTNDDTPMYKDLSRIGNFQTYIIEKIYTENLNTLLKESIKNSYKINAQIYELKSQELLYDASRNYYIPSAALNSEYQRKIYKKPNPTRADDLNIELSASMKVWSNNVTDLKNSAYYSLISERENYNQIVNNIYSTIISNVLKIELARTFLDSGEQYRARMHKLVERMNSAVSTGLLKKSDRLFADISIKKFEDSVLNVRSQIEVFKNTINNIAANEIYNDNYGVSQQYIIEMLEIPDSMFLMDNVVKNNFDIRARKAKLLSDKLSALGTNEDIKAEIVTNHKVKGTIPVGNDRFASYVYDSEDDSYFGFKLTFTGLNYANYKQKKSAIELVTKQLIELDEFLYQTTINLGVLKEQYSLLKDRLNNIDNQIVLTLNVINSLLQEVLVDESNTLDIFRNVSSISDLEINRLAIQNQLVDLATQIYALNAAVPDEFIID